ncbi:MAG: hypothetical protein IK085_10825 [Clostridia bacterium]|nr:hypothetical protein [Clostridia bacterium]
MKNLRAPVLALFLIICIILPSCSLPFTVSQAKQTALKIGVENIKGGFNPFFEGEDMNSVIMTQRLNRFFMAHKTPFDPGGSRPSS